MRPFTHDQESTILTWDEMDGFARIVDELCLPVPQGQVSCILESVTRPWCDTTSKFLERRAGDMWREPVVSRRPWGDLPASL